MSNPKNAARCIALLILVLAGIGPAVNFGLVSEAFHAPGGFLVHAAGHALDVRVAAALDLVGAALLFGIALAIWPTMRALSERLALALVALTTALLALAAAEGIAMHSMLSLSQAYASAAAPDAALYDALRGIVASTRNWTHYTRLVFASAFFFLLFTALMRFRLVPRLLAGFGMLAAVLQLAGVGGPLFGFPVVFPLLWPIGLALLALAVWLLVKGLNVRRS